MKQILYLDAPDIIVEQDHRAIFSVEVSKEAGTGHNVFQRFGRIAASVENGVPALYVYPEAVWVSRTTGGRWDQLNPLIFKTLERVMEIYGLPALFFYFPTDFRTRAPSAPTSSARGHQFDATAFPDQPNPTDPEMRSLFETIDQILAEVIAGGPGVLPRLIANPVVAHRRRWMQAEHLRRGGTARPWAPETSMSIVPTHALTDYLRTYAGATYTFSGFLASRPETLVYHPNASFRADPYTGCIAALDYLHARYGRTFEERHRNVAMAWGQFRLEDDVIRLTGGPGNSIASFTGRLRLLYADASRVLLRRDFATLSAAEIPRYFMQARFGTTFTKSKEIRVYSYFCDAILFPDGVLWREG